MKVHFTILLFLFVLTWSLKSNLLATEFGRLTDKSTAESNPNTQSPLPISDTMGGADGQFYEAPSGHRSSKSLAGVMASDTIFSKSDRRPVLWSAKADALFLNRSDPSAAILAFNTVDPTQNLNAADFNFGIHTGFDLMLGRSIGRGRSFELRYFGVDHWREAISAATTPGALLQINAAVPIFTLSGTGANANYSSALHNAEINHRRQIDEYWTMMAGFRYAELNERMSASLVGSAVPFNYDAFTRNRLYGFQLGAEAQLLSRQFFTLDGFGKAGLFGNAAAQDSAVNTGVVNLPASGRDSRTAFIGETGATGTLQLTDHLSIRSGYRLLWLDNVALASQQLSVSDFANGTGFAANGHTFYHGAFAGCEFRY